MLPLLAICLRLTTSGSPRCILHALLPRMHLQPDTLIPITLAPIAASAAQYVARGADGRVLRGSRFGTPRAPVSWVTGSTPPRAPGVLSASAGSSDGGAETPGRGGVAAHAVRPSPFAPELMLVALEDASLVLLRRSSPTPLARWPSSSAAFAARGGGGGGGGGLGGGAVVCALDWSPSRPSVFYVLERSRLDNRQRPRLFAWDLLRSTITPCAVYDVPAGSGGRVDGVDDSADAVVPTMMTLGPARAPRPFVALTLSHVEIRTLPLASWLTKPCRDELARLRSLAERML